MTKNENEKRIQRLKDVIKMEKITAYEIAKKTSLSEVGIGKIINGTIKKPNISTIEILSAFLCSNYKINKEWVNTGEGSKKYMNIPNEKEFGDMPREDRMSKLNEIAVFIAHNEEDMLKNPVFKNLIERKSYELAIKMIKSENWK